MYLMDMGERLGRFITGYRDRYFLPDKRNREIIYSYKPREGAEDAIYRQISDICISMKASDHIKMPDRIDNVVEVAMSSKEQKIYDSFKKDMVVQVKDTELDAVNAAALSGKLLQMANGAVYGDERCVLPIHDKKLDALEALIEAANGKPLLVAYWFQHDLSRILARFKEARVIDNAFDIADWNDGKISVGLIHPASAGHGLNLQEGGCTIVWFGLTWSLELYQQLNARLWRQGQKETVVIHHILTKGRIDADVMKGLTVRRAFTDAGFYLSGCCIWKKNALVLGRSPYQWIHEPCLFGWKIGGKHQWYSDRKQTTIWEYNRPKASREHPTMKPVALMAYPMKNSCMSNCIVLDPFLGSGSTLIAAEETGRICYGIELDEKFVDVIVWRYMEATGKTDVFVIRDGEKIPVADVKESE